MNGSHKVVFALMGPFALASALLAQNGAKRGVVERGAQIVRQSACTDCHTPKKFDPQAGAPVPDRERFLSGHPAGAPGPAGAMAPGDLMLVGPTGTSFKFPFGTVYAANLTPDETGLKGWSEEMFVRALRSGHHMGGTGRPIFPPMPWDAFRNLSDADLHAIYAYLRTLPPVKNDVPDPEVAPEVSVALGRAADAMVKSDQ